MKFSKLLTIFSFVALSAIVACKSKKEITSVSDTKPCEEKVTYETLKPLLTKSCNTSGCHDESRKRMNFKIYANFKSFGDKGDVKQQVLVDKNMPPREKLTGDELRMIRCWIEGGMLEK